jgi:nitrite reductase/ring-hydroxylating ferredoxin subunit
MPLTQQGPAAGATGLDRNSAQMASAALDLVNTGQILVIPNCIRQDGWLGRLQSIVREGLRSSGGDPGLSRTIRLEEMHRHYSGEQIVRAADATIRRVKPLSGRLLQEVFRGRLGMEERFWFDRRPKVRFHPPTTTLDEDPQVFRDYARRRGHGKVDAHDPHLDSWHHCPVNSVNLWIALGRVTPRNGMSAFPDTHGRARVERGQVHDVATNQWYGKGVDTDLEPGDAWLFPGDLLHTSILNASDETRVAISFRLTFSKPYFSGSGTESFVDSRYAGTPLEYWTLQHPADPVRRLVCRDHGGRYTVVARHCPHRGADLAAGELTAEGLVCPWHRLVFNPQDGASVGHCDHALAAVPCAVSHGEVVVPPATP